MGSEAEDGEEQEIRALRMRNEDPRVEDGAARSRG